MQSIVQQTVSKKITSASEEEARNTQPKASIIIPNWNGEKLLPACLDSLKRQSYQDFEIIVVDNASVDGSLALLAEAYPWVKVMRMDSNLFFSGAVNRGIQGSSSEILVLLNNDTEVEEQWLDELLRSLDEHPEAGMAASKMLLFDRRDVLNSAGDFYGRNGVPGNRGVWEKDEGQYDNSTYVFSACGGASAFRRSMLNDIGLLDEDFVGYCEDVDLAFRAHIAGYRCVYAPKARIYHRLSATGGGPLASYLCGRNFINVIVKDMPGPLLRKYWWRILAGQLRYTIEAILHIREPSARARIKGQFDGLLCIPKMLRKRRQVQAVKRVTDEYIDSILT